MAGAIVSIPFTLTVTSAANATLLVIANLATSPVVGRTLAIELTDATAVVVTAPDVVTSTGYPIASVSATIVGAEPVMIAAIALDASSAGAGVQTDDQVVLVFSTATNGLALTATNSNTALALSNGHSWLSGSGLLGAAVWSTGVEPNDTLTLTLSATAGAPSIAVGDTISIAAGAITDASGERNAASTPRPIIGSFGEGRDPALTPTIEPLLLSGVAAAGATSLLVSESGSHRVQVPLAATANGEVLVELVGAALAGSLPAGAPIAGSPFRVEVTYAATGVQPLLLPTLLDIVVVPTAQELGGAPVSGLVAYQLEPDGSWRILPTWVDRARSELHIAVAGNATVAVAAIAPRTQTLLPGWNLVPFVGAPNMPVSFLFAGLDIVVDAVRHWDATTQSYQSAFPIAPSISTLHLVQPNNVLWIHVRTDSPVEWALYGGALAARTQALNAGWMLIPWIGPESDFTAGAADLFGAAQAAFRWNPDTDAYDTFYASGPSATNTLTSLRPLDGLWVVVSADIEATWAQPGLP